MGQPFKVGTQSEHEDAQGPAMGGMGGRAPWKSVSMWPRSLWPGSSRSSWTGWWSRLGRNGDERPNKKWTQVKTDLEVYRFSGRKVTEDPRLTEAYKDQVVKELGFGEDWEEFRNKTVEKAISLKRMYECVGKCLGVTREPFGSNTPLGPWSDTFCTTPSRPDLRSECLPITLRVRKPSLWTMSCKKTSTGDSANEGTAPGGRRLLLQKDFGEHRAKKQTEDCG